MKTVDRYLCSECIENIKAAQLVFKEIPNHRGEKDTCDWCGKERYGRMIRIKYGKEGQ